MKTSGKTIAKKIVNIVLWVFLAFAILMTVFAFIANASSKEYPTVFGKSFLCVQSDSMNGSDSLYATTNWNINYGFKKGDLILGTLLSGEEKNKLAVGDVITFYQDLDDDGNMELNTHRIIEVLENGASYQTKGDNVAIKDGYIVDANRVEAKWEGTRIAGLGSFISFFRTSVGFLTCIVLPLALFFLYELIVLVVTIKDEKSKKTDGISKEEEEEIKKRAIEEYLAKQAKENNQSEK